MSLLRNATTIWKKGCANTESLIKQVIVRSPGDIKSCLLEAVNTSTEWIGFVKKAENAT